MREQRARVDNRQLFFSHELRVALWYILDEEFPSAEPNWMGGEIGGEGQRLLEEQLRKDLNKLNLASGVTVGEILRNFVVMLARPSEIVALLEAMPSVLLHSGRALGLLEDEHKPRVESLKKRIVDKLNQFGLPMMYTDQLELVQRAVDVHPVALSRLPRADDLGHRIQPLVESHPVLSLVFLDVDGLKAVNDRIGHDAGTACLAKFVEAMSPVVVGRGSIFRYGGDEFVVVLPNFSLQEAAATGERLRGTIEEAQIGDPPLTASVGVASSAGERSAAGLISQADAAAYASKFSGKNRVTTWPLDPVLAEQVAAARRIAQGR
jgi:diguanylate cyclase (GGDEF)-like protein